MLDYNRSDKILKKKLGFFFSPQSLKAFVKDYKTIKQIQSASIFFRGQIEWMYISLLFLDIGIFIL